MNVADYTNFPGIWKDIGFDKSKNIFYKVRHNDDGWEKLFDLPAFKTADKIFVIDQECESHQYMKADNRIQVWDSTISDHPRIHTYLFWFNWVREIEENMQLCKNLLPIDSKSPHIFYDALLGTLRPHKEFVLKKIKEFSMEQKFITGACAPHCLGFPSDYVYGGSYETGEWCVNYNEHQKATVSSFVPYDIYNKTWYSLVCETRGNGNNLFFTEKLAKPLIAGRIFVLFGQHKQLHYLKQLGFKTFDNIIDESYDSESDDILRYTQAWNQIEFLMSQNPVEIYRQCSSVLEHNRSVIQNTNWYDILMKDMYEKANNMV